LLTANAGAKSKLAKPIQDLIRTIFDVESMKKAMVEFEVCSLPFFYYSKIKKRMSVVMDLIVTGFNFS